MGSGLGLGLGGEGSEGVVDGWMEGANEEGRG